MKKSNYFALIILILIFPLIGWIIIDDLPKSYQNLELSSPDYDAREYVGLGTSELREGLTGENITVAVFDTGIFETHSVFGRFVWQNKIIGYYDWEINTTSSNPEDIDTQGSHGTFVSSIIAGRSIPLDPNDYIGIAPNANILAMKVFYMSEEEPSSDIFTLEQAIKWLVQNKDDYSVRIASMSLGVSYTASETGRIILDQIVENLVNNNILVVASAGNSGQDGFGTIESPASAESVLAVGGVDYEGEMASFSSKGPTYDNRIKPDVCAPAFSIQGALQNNFQAYGFASGTSFATPFVAGLAALMLEKNNSLSALELKNIISLTSYRTINPRVLKDNTQGWGIVQGYAALDALNSAIEITSNSQFNFMLDEDQPVLCIPVRTDSMSNYVFQLNQLDGTEAEMYLFDRKPDNSGNPQLISHSISTFEPYDTTNRITLSSEASHQYYLVIKQIHGTGGGDFSITMVIDFRLTIFFSLAGLNLLALIYIGFQYKKFKKLELR